MPRVDFKRGMNLQEKLLEKLVNIFHHQYRLRKLSISISRLLRLLRSGKLWMTLFMIWMVTS
jgi:hypothetical protein